MAFRELVLTRQGRRVPRLAAKEMTLMSHSPNDARDDKTLVLTTYDMASQSNPVNTTDVSTQTPNPSITTSTDKQTPPPITSDFSAQTLLPITSASCTQTEDNECQSTSLHSDSAEATPVPWGGEPPVIGPSSVKDCQRPEPKEDDANTQGSEARLRSMQCEHLIFIYECEECGSNLTKAHIKRLRKEAQEYLDEIQAQRRERVKMLNGGVKEAMSIKKRRRLFMRRHKQTKAEELQTETPARPRKIRFNLENVPKPVKDREFMYRLFQMSNEGMLKQWQSRLESLSDNKDAWWEELSALAAKRGWSNDGLEHTERCVEKSESDEGGGETSQTTEQR